MKKSLSFLSIASLLVMFTSCESIFGDINSDSNTIPSKGIPEGVTVQLSIDEQPTVHYHDATIVGLITVSAFYSEDLEEVKPETVTVYYGKTSDNLSGTAVGSSNRQENYYYSSKRRYDVSAKLPNLEDGAVYYYQIIATFGKDTRKTDVKSFFTLPEGAIDLDLPSKTKWSSANLGANYPDEAGMYIAWGETEEKKQNAAYTWSFYKWCNGEYSKLLKYTTQKTYAVIEPDGKYTLQDEDDAAIRKLGDKWHTPTIEEWNELKSLCGWTPGTLNGRRGWFVRSKANPDDPKKVVFLPLTGYKDGVNVAGDNNCGYYWTSSLYTLGLDYYARNFGLTTYSNDFNMGYRCYGESIRPTLKP